MSLGTVLSGIGGFFVSIKNIVDSFFVKNPIVKNVVDGTIKAGLVGGLTYVADKVSPGSSSTITTAGVGAAVLVGVKTYAQHVADKVVTTTLNGLTGADNTSATVPPQLSPSISPSQVVVPPVATLIATAIVDSPVQALNQAQALIQQHTTALTQAQADAQTKINNLADAAKTIADVLTVVATNTAPAPVKP